jgi:hypothetical protein
LQVPGKECIFGSPDELSLLGEVMRLFVMVRLIRFTGNYHPGLQTLLTIMMSAPQALNLMANITEFNLDSIHLNHWQH